MPAPVTVWAVELERGSPVEEVRGSLALASDALVFSPNDDRPPRRYALGDIVRTRRLRGSPVLLIQRETPEGHRRTAFYFVQPPPLPRTEEPVETNRTPLRRNTRRRSRRRNVSYLGVWNQEKKALLREWERQVRIASGAARGRGN